MSKKSKKNKPSTGQPETNPASLVALEPRAIVSVLPSSPPAVWPNDPNAGNAPITSTVVKGGRLSVDNEQSFYGSPHVVLPPGQPEQSWSLYKLDSSVIQRMSPTRLMELLADMSPDVSRALWDFLRLCNPGYSCTVYSSKGKNAQPDAVGQKMLDDFFVTLEGYYGSMDVIIGRLFMSAFMRGALMAELVLDENGHDMVDLAIPDPASIRFVRSQDKVRGPIWQLSQWQNRPSPFGVTSVGGYVPLLWPTIKYIPIDPFPGVPYGRPMASPALFSTLFLLGLMHDLRRVISQQGYPRLDISIDMEKLKASLPERILNDDAEYKKWVEGTIKDVTDAYARLEPDSTFVHTDVASVNRPIGAVDASSLGAIDGIVEALERMSTRALKTMPFMMALSQNSSETLANREWEVQTNGIKTLQKHGAAILQQLCDLGMRSQGHIGYTCWCFDMLQKTEAFRNAQTQAVTVSNAVVGYNAGLISMDEAAQLAFGKDTADATEPRVLTKGDIPIDLLTGAPRSDGATGAGGKSRLQLLEQLDSQGRLRVVEDVEIA